MQVDFSRLDKQKTIVIRIRGRVSAEDIRDMRRQTVAEAEETEYSNFIMDIRDLESIDSGDTFATFELGEEFNDIGFSRQNNTAVLMPTDEEARRQAEFLHTVEINRHRGALLYVDTVEEALSWFEDMGNKQAL